jgi:hypothetical protein
MSDAIQNAPGLTAAQVELFWSQGFVRNIPVLTADQARSARRKFEVMERQAIDRLGDAWPASHQAPWNHPRHPIQRWCQAMSKHPRILAAVRSVLGDNLLIRNGDVFIKEPGNTRRISWHVDSTAPPQSADLMVTAWLGLTASGIDNGCMEFIAGSHRHDLPKRATDRQNLTFKGAALQAIEQGEKCANIMAIGELSLHCFRTAHRSNGNHSNDRRFGYVTRFMAPNVDPGHAEAGQAFLACGQNQPAHLSLQPSFPISWTRQD